MTPYIFTPKTLQIATAGVWHHITEFTATRVITDTRKVQAGDVFLAIVGEHFDGHDFVSVAKERGAVAVICQKSVQTPLPTLMVADTKLALGDLARYRRQQHPNLTVVAITGSSGKTTAKEMLGSVLSQVGKTLITKGNLNNELGVPITLLELCDEHRFAVFELGANHVGEITYTADIVKPHVACVLNIGTAHLGEFGGQENIAKAKSEIFSSLTQSGVAVVPFDNEYGDFLYQQACKRTRNILCFGEKAVPIAKANIDWTKLSVQERAYLKKADMVELAGDVFADEIELFDTKSAFNIHLNGLDETCSDDVVQSVAVTLPFVGEHNVTNALAVSAIATALNVDLATIAKGLAQAIPAKGRLTHLSLTIGGISHLLIDDTYNANPTSVLVCADVLASKVGQKILVLGDIGELGESAVFEHKKLGQTLAKNSQDGKFIDYLITVGPLMAYCHQGAIEMIEQLRLPMRARHFGDKLQASSFLLSLLTTPSAILLKGSRSQKMETIIDDLYVLNA